MTYAAQHSRFGSAYLLNLSPPPHTHMHACTHTHTPTHTHTCAHARTLMYCVKSLPVSTRYRDFPCPSQIPQDGYISILGSGMNTENAQIPSVSQGCAKVAHYKHVIFFVPHKPTIYHFRCGLRVISAPSCQG